MLLSISTHHLALGLVAVVLEREREVSASTLARGQASLTVLLAACGRHGAARGVHLTNEQPEPATLSWIPQPGPCVNRPCTEHLK